jgi:hypothetical protein
VGHDHPFALVLEIPEYIVGVRVLTDCSNRYTNHQILATFAVHVLTFAMGATLGKVEGVIA